MMWFLYRAYQLVVCVPLMLLATVVTGVLTVVLCSVGNAAYWGYMIPKWWARLMCRLPLLPVEVVRSEKVERGRSYVFVANHQGPYDIFLVYGYLGHSFRWLMKRELESVPLIGVACRKAGHIMVDKRGPKAIARTQAAARRALEEGASLVVFPEGSRTFCGHMAHFRRGAFMLGHELGLPVVPVTIDGSFDVLPRQRGLGFLSFHRLRLVIHDPIEHRDDLASIMAEAYEVIEGDLPLEYRGLVENPDQ